MSRKLKVEYYALKGGVNLRFFFNSFRYSEDMDLDVGKVEVNKLKYLVMAILESRSFQDTLASFGINKVISPTITKAKQTETTQRFKVHLITSSSEDLFTKVEFSRRGFKGNPIIQPISNLILREYKLTPLLVPHYDLSSTLIQKVNALAARSVIQARDVFDLYILNSQLSKNEMLKVDGTDRSNLLKAYNNVFEISFEQFRDTVILYLASEDQGLYSNPSLWDEIKLKVAHFIEEL
ncbi:MAG: nucleotidyl transferase AbiEii/AbiGii toxin family protein [bacterium]